ncbi:Uncharacterised protein [Achromobacter xylosoxidans]|nr:hypothetical protein LMG26846_05546 [Achromobacter insuavis]CUJ32368.1 Uncharacterised protein [Achromobacter xylosoxidans]CUJ40719.1 Uncharacterised protein [Achromobacter sp. 2789STDY5608621]
MRTPPTRPEVSMDNLPRLLYLQEIQAQCRIARIAFGSLTQWPSPYPTARTVAEGEVQTAAFFRDMHSLLTHAGVISRLLWPAGKKRDARHRRAEVLRELLDLPASNHLLCDRSLRDGLEHFDERLDQWAAQQEASGDYWQDCIGPWEVPEMHGAKDHNVMRHYDPYDKIFRFQGKPVHVPAIGDALAELQRRVDRLVAQLLALLYPTPDHVPAPQYPSVMPF